LSPLLHVTNLSCTGDETPRKAQSDVKPISIVYEILRKWDEALSAFEYINK